MFISTVYIRHILIFETLFSEIITNPAPTMQMCRVEYGAHGPMKHVQLRALLNAPGSGFWMPSLR